MRTKLNWMWCGVLGVALVLAACNGAQKEATDAAINAAQTAINTAQADAAKYVPDQLAAAQTSLQAARDAAAKGDYQTALTAAQDAANKAKDLAAAAAAKKDQLMQAWSSLSASAPHSLDEVKKKLDAYSHGAKMPAGMDKSKLADAKTQYEQLKQGWADASAAAQQGDLTGAMAKASGWKDALAQLMETLGIKS
jgi:hypothetical protein